MTGRHRFGRRKASPSSLVQHRVERLEPKVYGVSVSHAAILAAPDPTGNPTALKKTHADSIIYQQTLRTNRFMIGAERDA
jgi:hypothetical protein